MRYIIQLTNDPHDQPTCGAPVSLSLGTPVHRWAAHKRNTFDDSDTCCRYEDARSFKGFASARQWLIRHRLSSVDAMFMGLAGPTPSGPFTKWEIIPVTI
jgi:hypothetical protein